MALNVNVSDVARNFAMDYRRNNPSANESTVQAETRNYIQDVA